jgi:hypothetical protein
MHIWCWDCVKKSIDSKSLIIDSGHVAIQLNRNFFDFYPQKNVELNNFSQQGIIRRKSEHQVALFYLTTFIENQHYKINEAIEKNLLFLNDNNIFESSSKELTLPKAYDFELDIHFEIHKQMEEYLINLSLKEDFSLIYHLTKNNCMTFTNDILLKFHLIEHPVQHRLYPENYRNNLIRFLNNGQFCGKLKQILKKRVGFNEQSKEFCWLESVQDK